MGDVMPRAYRKQIGFAKAQAIRAEYFRPGHPTQTAIAAREGLSVGVVNHVLTGLTWNSAKRRRREPDTDTPDPDVLRMGAPLRRRTSTTFTSETARAAGRKSVAARRKAYYQ